MVALALELKFERRYTGTKLPGLMSLGGVLIFPPKRGPPSIGEVTTVTCDWCPELTQPAILQPAFERRKRVHCRYASCMGSRKKGRSAVRNREPCVVYAPIGTSSMLTAGYQISDSDSCISLWRRRRDVRRLSVASRQRPVPPLTEERIDASQKERIAGSAQRLRNKRPVRRGGEPARAGFS